MTEETTRREKPDPVPWRRGICAHMGRVRLARVLRRLPDDHVEVVFRVWNGRNLAMRRAVATDVIDWIARSKSAYLPLAAIEDPELRRWLVGMAEDRTDRRTVVRLLLPIEDERLR